MKMLKMLAALALALASWAVQAGPFFASKDGGMVWDQETGNVWMRCGVGQRWDGKTCLGFAGRYNFHEAQKTVENANRGSGFGGYRDWTVPSLRQLASLVLCSRGVLEQSRDIEDGGPSVPYRCPEGSVIPTADPVAFPVAEESVHWSSSQYAVHAGSAWGVGFSSGVVHLGSRSDRFVVRLVRAAQMSGGDAAQAFPRKLPAPDSRAWASVESAREFAAEAAKREEQAEREQARRKAEEAERAAIAAALRKGPQQLYILAGQSQRGKPIEISGRSFDAAELYELIVEKFPASEFAVRASDQLNAMDRSAKSQAAANRAAESQRQADQNASNRAACFSGVRSCEANCSSAWSNDYRMAQSCISRCQRSCN